MKVGNCFSNYASVGSGVPQERVLGPLLFLLFINDICDIFGDFLSVKLFANDLKVYVVIDSMDKTERLQNGLNKFREWSKIWQNSVVPERIPCRVSCRATSTSAAGLRAVPGSECKANTTAGSFMHAVRTYEWQTDG